MIAIFDLDGTLIDSAPDIHAAGNAALASERLPQISYDQARSFIGNGARKFVERMELAADGKTIGARTQRLHRAFLAEYETAHALTQTYDGAEAALNQLRANGWRLGLCTNKPIGPTRAVLEHLGWSNLFGAVLGGDSLPVLKPDPAPLRAVAAELGAGPLVYVGDSETDAATARNAGTAFALFTRGYRKTPVAQIPHDAAFDDWAALPELAARLAR